MAGRLRVPRGNLFAAESGSWDRVPGGLGILQYPFTGKKSAANVLLLHNFLTFYIPFTFLFYLHLIEVHALGDCLRPETSAMLTLPVGRTLLVSPEFV